MLNKVLVPLDGSALAECVLPHAVSLAKMTKAEVIVLHVVEQGNGADQLQSVDPLSWHLRKAEAQAYLDGVGERLQQAGLITENVLLEGQPAERTLEFAREQGVDLILLSSHGRSGLSEWNVSSVVQKIIHRAYTSVMIIRAYQLDTLGLPELHYKRILVPLDGSQRAEAVLPMLNSLGQAQQAELVLAHVVSRPDMPRRVPLTPREIELVDGLVERNQEAATQYFDQLQARLSVPVEIRIVVDNNVVTALDHLAKKEAVDLVLLSAHGYSAENRFPYGSLVISFIAYGSTPLLIIQDLPEHRLERSQTEVMATQTGHEYGGRMVIYDRPSI